MNEVSNQPLRRSTTPLDSGSSGGSSTSLVASVPMNAATPSARRWPAADAGLVVPDQPPRDPPELLDQLPRPQQQVLGLPGRDHPAGHEPRVRGGDHQHRQQLGRAVLERDLPRREPQVALRRVTRPPRSAGPPGRSAGAPAAAASRCRGTTGSTPSTRPARPAPSPACPGSRASSARTRGSNAVNDVGPGVRSYLGGASDFTALITVVREIPNRSAIRAFGTPSAASLLISAQSSKVITLQSLSVHFSPPKLFSFRAPSTPCAVVDGRTRALIVSRAHAEFSRGGTRAPLMWESTTFRVSATVGTPAMAGEGSRDFCTDR